MKIKLSDYVAKFIAGCGVDTVFAISGGASLHLIHSIDDCKDLSLICPHHEQAVAMGADGYSRAKGPFGVSIATSGPGATNLITGACCSFYDSVPVLFITGQVSTFRNVGNTQVRQVGFQETPIVDIVNKVTKYAASLKDAKDIRYELEKAVSIMLSGRPGPALIDIPDNLQREMIDDENLLGYQNEIERPRSFSSAVSAKSKILEALSKSKRPVIVAGWGVHLAGMQANFISFAETLNVPVALTWGASDLLKDDHDLNLGRFGTHGMRKTNFAVQNADLIIALGSRLDTKSTGTPVNSFAREATKIVIDIDPCELGKFQTFGLEIDLLIQDDLRNFFSIFTLNELSATNKDLSKWYQQIKVWQDLADDFDSKRYLSDGPVNPYSFFTLLSEITKENTQVVIDTGCSVAWAMQTWRVRGSQRIFHDFNNTAMGWSLPAAVGCFFAAPKKPLVCVLGDGSLMMCLQELATIKHHMIPMKIIIINNNGYSMIRQTQDQWMDSRYIASSKTGGLSFPNFSEIARAFGIEYKKIEHNSKIKSELMNILDYEGPVICEVLVPETARVIPQVKFGRPNEDMEPLMPRELFAAQMLIEDI